MVMIEISLFTYLISYNICFPWEIWALYLSVDNPQPIKLCSFTLRVMPGVKYQAPLRCIYIWVFWHFQFLFPVFLFPFVIGCRCPRGKFNEKSTFVCSYYYKARVWAQKVWSLQALLFSVLYSDCVQDSRILSNGYRGILLQAFCS